MDTKSRKVKGYLRLLSEEVALLRASRLATGARRTKLEQLTGGQLGEADRILATGQPYVTEVKVRTRGRILV